MQDGEKVPAGALYLRYEDDDDDWQEAAGSVGLIRTATSDGKPFFIPIQPTTTPQPIESTQDTMSLQAITIMHTPKVVPGSIAANEEILVPTSEISAADANSGLLLVAAQNADAILKASKTSTLRVITRLLD